MRLCRCISDVPYVTIRDDDPDDTATTESAVGAGICLYLATPRDWTAVRQARPAYHAGWRARSGRPGVIRGEKARRVRGAVCVWFAIDTSTMLKHTCHDRATARDRALIAVGCNAFSPDVPQTQGHNQKFILGECFSSTRPFLFLFPFPVFSARRKVAPQIQLSYLGERCWLP